MTPTFKKTSTERDHLQRLSRLVRTKVKSLPKGRRYFAQIRAVFLFLLYWCFYACAITQGEKSVATFYVLYALMGIVGFLLFVNVIHEACHGNIFSSARWNNLAYQIFDLLGMNSFIWKKRHNILHHNYTNIAGWDSDIEQSGLIKVYPHEETTRLQRYQHLFIFLFYPISLLNWVVLRDFKDFLNERRIVRKIVSIPFKEWIRLLFFKAFFFFYIILVPYLFFDWSLKTVVLATVLFLLVAGTVSLTTLLTPHINVGNAFPEIGNGQQMKTNWLQHQLMTTNDLNLNNFFSRYVLGNFNFHVAHHLFPTISSVYAPEVTTIIQEYAQKHGLPYRSISLKEAILQHYQLIYNNARA